MKVYTKTGDQGETGLWGGQRVRKDSPRVHAYGTVDELNSVLGVIRANGVDAELDGILSRVQDELFVLGADLATPESTKERIERVDEGYITRLEQEIDRFEGELEPLRQFILPGGTVAAAHLHIARTVCRRAEREATNITLQGPINNLALAYLNRLSDWFFTLARVANKRAGVVDIPWRKPGQA